MGRHLLRGNQGWTKVFPSQPFLTYVGKISYSLYLWHWPVIVLGRHFGNDVPVSLPAEIMPVPAVVSYPLVEQTFRRRDDAIPLVGGGFAGALGVVATLAFMTLRACDAPEFDRPQTYGRIFDIDPRSPEDEKRRA